MKKRQRPLWLFIFLAFFSAKKVLSQIGAEAQGGKLTMWAAVGIDQELTNKWLSVTDIGYGRHSDPDNYDLTKRLGLNVITQDFVFKPHEHWGYVFSFGYWRRNFYEDNIPYDARPAPYIFRNEIRPYQKIFYTHHINSIKITHLLRTDNRFYYNQYFSHAWTTPFEFRLRYMETWRFPLSADKKNWFIAMDEVLTAIDNYSKPTAGKNWSPYQFTENRFSVYYRRRLGDKNVDLDFGLMHQYWRDKPGINAFNVSYNLMFDLIIYDPFGKKKDEK